MHYRKNQEGVVLVVTMLAMVCVVVFGVAYLEVATTQAMQPEAAIARAQSRSLAEGGIEIGIRRLIDEPTFRGTIGPVFVGGGSYTVTITENAGIIEIEAGGNDIQHGCVESSLVAQVTVGEIPTEEMEITHTFVVGTKIDVQKSSAGWNGSVSAVDGVEVSQGGDYTGVVVPNPDFVPIVVDVTSLPIGADHTFTAPDVDTPYELGPGSLEGDVYVDGDLTVVAPFDFTGTLLVEGNIRIVGDKHTTGDIVELDSGSDSTVLISTGSVTFKDVETAGVNGSIFSLGKVEFDKSDFVGVGSIVTNDKLHFKEADGTYNFDPSITADPPSAVSYDGSASEPLSIGGESALSFGFGGESAMSLGEDASLSDPSTDESSSGGGAPMILSIRPK